MQISESVTPPPERSGAKSRGSAKRPGRARFHPGQIATFVVSLGLTTGAFFWSVQQQRAAIEGDVARRTAAIASSFESAIADRIERLGVAAAFLHLTRGENRADLRSFLTELARPISGGVAIDWVPLLEAGSVKAHEEQQWLQGFPGFHVHRGERDLPPAQEYLPLHFGVGAGAAVEGINLTAGSDLAATHSLASPLAESRASGAAATTAVHVVGPEGRHPALLILSPVFEQPQAQRAANTDGLFGYVLGLFDLGAMAREAVAKADLDDLTIEVNFANRANESISLWSHRSGRSESEPVLLSLWKLVSSNSEKENASIDAGGRRWTIASSAGPSLLIAHLSWTPWVLAFQGLLLTAFATSVVGSNRKRKAALAAVGRRARHERREFSQKLGELGDDIEREKTDRRRTEESLFREKRQFRLMFNAVPAMIHYKDTKNRFLLVNEAAASALGRTVGEMEGKPCSEIIPARAYELYRDDLEIVQSGKPKLGLIEKNTLPNGSVRWTRTDKLPEYDSMGRVVGILVFSQDITEQRGAEAEVRRLNEELEHRVAERTAELRVANQELESFAYSVSHDLRAPLRTIDGFSKLVLEEYAESLPDSGKDYLERLRGAAQRLSRLIDDLLRLTRVSRAEYRPEELDLSSLARQVAEDLRLKQPGRRVDFVIEATPFCRGDRALMTTALENLLGNSWKFSSKSAEPRIEFGSTTLEEGQTAFYVRDNGVGFDMVYANQLFGVFQRLHGQDDFEGSGIGLAVTQLIVRRHAGRVWAQSEPNQGSTFYFTLGA